MPVDNVSEFWTSLERARIVDPSDLSKLTERLSDTSDPKMLASQLVRDRVLTRWQAKFLLSGRTQLRISSYILRDRLHRDELGDRFLAIHEQLGREVELQLLPLELTNHPDDLARFLDQAQRAAHLDHPNIVHVYDVDHEQGRYFLVTEKIRGVPLNEQTNGMLGSVHQVVESISGLCDAVQYAHHNDVVHGSIDQSNILVGDDGKVRLRNIALSTAARCLSTHDESMHLQSSKDTDIDGVFCVANYLVSQNRSLANRNPSLITGTLRAGGDEVGAMVAHCQTQALPETRLLMLRQESRNWLERNQISKDMPVDQNPVSGEQNAYSQEAPEFTPAWNRRLLPIVALAISTIALIAGAVALVQIYGGSDNKDGLSSNTKNATGNPEKIEKDGVKNDTEPALPNSPLIEGADKTDAQAQSEAADGQTVEASKANVAKNQADQQKDNNDSKDAGADKNAQQQVAETKPTESKSADEKSAGEKTADKSDSEAAVAGADMPKPFAEMAAHVDLPEPGSPEFSIGKVFAGKDFLLAMTLKTDRSIAREKIEFTLERDNAENQKWNVFCSPKNDVNEIVAVLQMSDDELIFRWTENAIEMTQANYFRNCLLSLETRGESMDIQLRKPVTFPPVTLTIEDAQSKIDVPLQWLPQPNAIRIEMKLPSEGLPEHVIHDENLTVGDREKAVVIYLHREENKRYCWIRCEASTSGRIKIETTLEFLASGTAKTYSPKLFDRYVAAAQGKAIQVKTELERWKAYQPPFGQKEATEKKIKDLSKLLEVVNEEYNTAVNFKENIIPAVADKPFNFEVYYELGDSKILLAKTGE